jgi:hypothetical protein
MEVTMNRRILRIGNAPALAVVLGSGVLAVFSRPADAWAQQGTVTCWAESCTGNVCVRVQIKCPKIIEPVP